MGLGSSYWSEVIEVLRDIIPIYDKVNSIISLGKDVEHRNRGISGRVLKGNKILDAGSGFGNMSKTALKLTDGNTIAFDQLVLAGTGHLVDQGISAWRSCWNLYFKTDQAYLEDDIIGLQTDSTGLINNFSFLFNESGEPIISVTVIGESGQSTSSIISTVESELWTSLGINAVECIQVFQINQALPIIDHPIAPKQVSSSRPDIFICGDLYSNASLHAAMESGKQVADRL